MRGDTDYVPKDYCQVAFACPSTGCRGEDATEVSFIGSSVKSGPTMTQDKQPITKTFSSGPALSGAGNSFARSIPLLRMRLRQDTRLQILLTLLTATERAMRGQPAEQQ